jgi:hypothetical protein
MSEQRKTPNTPHEEPIRDIDALAPAPSTPKKTPQSPAGGPSGSRFSKPYRVRVDASLPANDTTDEAYQLAEHKGVERTTYAGPPIDEHGDATGPVCGQCGYSLRGLKSPRCPECGHHEHAPVERTGVTAELKRESRRIARKTYLRLIMPAAIGAVFYLGVAALVKAPLESAVLVALLPVGVLLAVVGIKIAEWITDSSDDFLVLTALRCAAAMCLTLPIAYGFTHMLNAAAGVRVVWGYAIPTVLATFVAMWVWEETEYDDALFRGIALTLASYTITAIARVAT